MFIVMRGFDSFINLKCLIKHLVYFRQVFFFFLSLRAMAKRLYISISMDAACLSSRQFDLFQVIIFVYP